MDFISSAYAAADATAAVPGVPDGGLMNTVFMLAIFAVLVYFILLRPQNKRVKAHRDLISGLEVGDEVAINGGMLGKIVRVKDDFMVVQIADGVEVKCQRQAITMVLPKETLKSI
jgi:preprotein translocase subunit YajC